MKLFNPNQTPHRRGFLGLLTSGAAFGTTTLLNLLQAMAKTPAPTKGEPTPAVPPAIINTSIPTISLPGLLGSYWRYYAG
jgi:hypothetical protein